MTRRAILIGLLLAALINLWVQYAEFAVRSSLITIAHLPIAVLLPLFLLTAVVNPLLGLIRPAGRLSSSELFLIFALTLIGSTVPGFGFAVYFLRVIPVPHYFASPENQWGAVFFPYLPEWLVVGNRSGALAWFFEGLPQGQAVPWGIWIIPVLWWMSFVGALFLGGACLVVILRRQWIEHERLTFPLAQIPLTMIQTDSKRLWPPYLRNRLFWIGFAVPLLVIGWNIITYFIPIGLIRIGTSYPLNVGLGREFPALVIKINFLVLAAAFFTNLEVLFSVWFFILVQTIETGILNRFGVSTVAGTQDLNAVIRIHFIGGFVVFVLWGFWVARRHLKAVALHALGRGPGLDDQNELISYRLAFWGMILALVYTVAWLHSAGMSFKVMAFFLPILYILYIGIARIVAETGLAYLDLPVNANEFAVSVLGSSQMSVPSLTNLGLANVYARNWRFFSMTALTHLMYMSGALKRRQIRILGLVILTVAISMAVSIGWTVYMGYNPGQTTSFRGVSESLGAVIYMDVIVKWTRNVTVISQMEKLFFLFGAIIAGGLIALRYWFPWWPLHPIGFAIAGSNVVRVVAFTIFLAWLIKLVLLKVWGVRRYRQAQPFFVGMLTGYALGVGLSFLVDVIWFPGQGHLIHTW